MCLHKLHFFFKVCTLIYLTCVFYEGKDIGPKVGPVPYPALLIDTANFTKGQLF